MDLGDKITVGCFGDKGAIEDSGYKVLGVLEGQKGGSGCVNQDAEEG